MMVDAVRLASDARVLSLTDFPWIRDYNIFVHKRAQEDACHHTKNALPETVLHGSAHSLEVVCRP
jgi:hypothetical protein